MSNDQTIFILKMLGELDEAGSWCGETHIQKCLYLLHSLEDVAFEYEYVMYKHGPYSFELHDELSRLEAAFLIERISTPPYGSRLKDTDLGKRFMTKGLSKNSADTGAIKRIAEEFGPCSVAELERYATAAFVRQANPEFCDDQVTQEITKIKPHVTADKANNAVEKLKDYKAAKSAT